MIGWRGSVIGSEGAGARSASERRSAITENRIPRMGGGARACTPEVVLDSALRRTLRVNTRPVTFVLSRMQVYRTSRTVVLHFDPVQCSRVAAQLAGPGRNLGPPCMPGSVCRIPRRILDLAVCIPSEQISHRTPLSHLKGSELFEILPCENASIIRQLRKCGIDLRKFFRDAVIALRFFFLRCGLEAPLRANSYRADSSSAKALARS